MTPLSRNPTAPGPRLSVLAVVTRETAAGAEVLLVRRANPPQRGHWGFPGGKVGWGEDIARAAVRELKEETGIDGRDPVVFETVDLIVPGPTGAAAGAAGAVDHHLMVAVRLTWRAGVPAAGDDALEACWVPAGDLPRPLCADVAALVARAIAGGAA